jgi:transcriptional regulator with XRE-family HTH domain
MMKLDTIGKNIRKFREAKKLRQEDLAEKAELTTNYIGMIERGEKIPALDTFIKILNALGVSADMVLSDVLDNGYTVKNSMLNEKLEKLVPEDRNKIYEVIDTMMKQSKQILP